jgi:peptidoglycan/xylan/chitin deacetylase (PgdA/CDA1 family)
LTTVTEEEIDYQLRSTNTKIQQVTGIKPKFARPPYGSTNETVRNVMAKNGLREVIWSQDGFDWAGRSWEEVFNQLTLVPPGGTFVMHDWTQGALDVIPAIHWYFNTYWSTSPICPGRLAATTNVQPVMDWPGLFFFARAVR